MILQRLQRVNLLTDWFFILTAVWVQVLVLSSVAAALWQHCGGLQDLHVVQTLSSHAGVLPIWTFFLICWISLVVISSNSFAKISETKGIVGSRRLRPALLSWVSGPPAGHVVGGQSTWTDQSQTLLKASYLHFYDSCKISPALLHTSYMKSFSSCKSWRSTVRLVTWSTCHSSRCVDLVPLFELSQCNDSPQMVPTSNLPDLKKCINDESLNSV